MVHCTACLTESKRDDPSKQWPACCGQLVERGCLSAILPIEGFKIKQARDSKSRGFIVDRDGKNRWFKR